MYSLNKEMYRYIYNELGAKYGQAMKDAAYNLENDEEKNLKYLGTYFPRSYKESYTVFKNIINFLIQNDYLKNKDEINILDLGAGTGGDLFGALHALNEMLSEKKFNIFSVDGNENALNLQKEIFNHFWQNKGNVDPSCEKFNSGDEIADFIKDKFSGKRFDIIMSSKFLSEMLKFDENVWYKILKVSEDILNPDGIVFFNDVVTNVSVKNKWNGGWIPCVMNDNVRSYVKESAADNTNTLKLISPFCCSKNIKTCFNTDCYLQRQVQVIYHDKPYNSKINYKTFVKDSYLYQELYEKLENHFNSEICPHKDCSCIICLNK